MRPSDSAPLLTRHRDGRQCGSTAIGSIRVPDSNLNASNLNMAWCGLHRGLHSSAMSAASASDAFFESGYQIDSESKHPPAAHLIVALPHWQATVPLPRPPPPATGRS